MSWPAPHIHLIGDAPWVSQSSLRPQFCIRVFLRPSPPSTQRALPDKHPETEKDTIPVERLKPWVFVQAKAQSKVWLSRIHRSIRPLERRWWIQRWAPTASAVLEAQKRRRWKRKRCQFATEKQFDAVEPRRGVANMTSSRFAESKIPWR